MENTDYMQNPEFKDWLKSIGFDEKALKDQIDNDDFGRLDDLIRRFEEKKLKDEDDYMTFSQKANDGNPGNELDAYYQDWCEKEHQPPYVYENTQEESPAYGMKYYKTPEDKAAGKPAARALYHYKKNVEVECADDKGPDYEFIDALVRKAALDGQPGIKFGEEMTPEFANKLAAACVKYGMKMKGQPEKIDVSEFADQLTPEQKADIDKYNAGEKLYMDKYSQKVAIAKDYAAHGIKEADVSKYKDPAEQAAWLAANKEAGITPKGGKAFYSLHDDQLRNLPEAAKTQLKAHNAENVAKLYESAKKLADIYKQDNPGKAFDLSTSQFQDPKSAALMYAAYTAAGVQVTGIDKVTEKTQGMFQTETQGYMPEEARNIVADYNYGVRKQQIRGMKQDQKQAYQDAVSVDEANRTEEQQLTVDRRQERLETLQTRRRVQNGQATDKDKEFLKNRGNVLEELRKRQQGGRP